MCFKVKVEFTDRMMRDMPANFMDQKALRTVAETRKAHYRECCAKIHELSEKRAHLMNKGTEIMKKKLVAEIADLTAALKRAQENLIVLEAFINTT